MNLSGHGGHTGHTGHTGLWGISTRCTLQFEKYMEGRSRKEEAAARGLDEWWVADFGRRKVAYIILDNTWKEQSARGLHVTLPTSSPSNPSSSSPNPSSYPYIHPTRPPPPQTPPLPLQPLLLSLQHILLHLQLLLLSLPTLLLSPYTSSNHASRWIPPLPPSLYLSWQSGAADMRWSCLKSPLRVLRGGAPTPGSHPACLPSGDSALAAHPTAANKKVKLISPYNTICVSFPTNPIYWSC